MRTASLLRALFCALLLIATSGTSAAQTPLLNVKKSDGTQVLVSDADGNLLAKGTYNVGTIPATGAGVRMMWYARKGAFRAGMVSATQWNDASIAPFSVALGYNTIASAAGSTALGYSTTASGEYSTALGLSTTASGHYSTALGNGTTASGAVSTALGYYTIASGYASTTLGSYASTNSQEGAFVYGDNSTTTAVTATAPNQFVVRATGGAIFSDMVWSKAGGFMFPDGTTLATKPPIGTNANGAVHVSDDDGFVATGTWSIGALPATGAGTRMLWYPRKAAFRAGRVTGSQWDDASIAPFSVALGYNTIASAAGSTALGYSTTASGEYSTALGLSTTASGHYSTALGNGTTATGAVSTALGYYTIASGYASTTLGSYASTNGQAGAFVYGDNSGFAYISAAVPNQFLVRAAGGTNFYSNAGLTAGVSLASGAGAWASVSDVNRKHLFSEIDGEAVLSKIRIMPIREWSYKAQNPGIRHLGPTAQDFYGAFKLGESDLTITTTDIDGVNLLAAQALEKRTADLQRELATLRAENAALKSGLAETLRRLERLEAALSSEREP